MCFISFLSFLFIGCGCCVKCTSRNDETSTQQGQIKLNRALCDGTLMANGSSSPRFIPLSFPKVDLPLL